MKKSLPGWQQVLLVVLNNVPKAKNGQDAWNGLNADEKTAVMAFLAEHCGEDRAQSALEETIPLARPHSVPRWLKCLFALALYLALDCLLTLLKVGPEVVKYGVIALLIGVAVMSMIRDDRSARLEEIWRERTDYLPGIRRVLELMHNVTQLAWWEENRMRLLWFVVLMVLLVLFWLL